MEFRRYLIIYGLTVLSMLALVGTVNLLVDPDGRIRLVDNQDFNQLKVAPNTDSRQGKAVALQQCDYDVIIFGSSRAETGLNPTSRLFAGKSVYNAALKATSMYELNRLAKFAAIHQQPEAIIVGLDFFAFNRLAMFQEDYAESLLAESLDVGALSRYALSLKTLRASAVTVQWNMRGIAGRCAHNGFGVKYNEVKDPREAFNLTQARYIANPSTYGDYQLSADHLRNFEEFLRLFASKGVRVYPFISPMHATDLIVITELGLLPQLRDWERELVRIVSRVNADLRPDPLIVLWDFSGYNSITTENVPEAGEQTQMRWYRDSSHYRPNVGDMVLARMLGKELSIKPPADFGIRLSDDNIESVLNEKQTGARLYEQADPAEVANSRRLVKENRQATPPAS